MRGYNQNPDARGGHSQDGHRHSVRPLGIFSECVAQTFQRFMDRVARGGGLNNIFVYIDDILVPSKKKTNKKNEEQHEADLMWGYNQILMAKADIPKTAIVTPFSLWEFLKMRHSDLPTLHGQDRAGP